MLIFRVLVAGVALKRHHPPGFLFRYFFLVSSTKTKWRNRKQICLCDGVNGLKDIYYQQWNIFDYFGVKCTYLQGPYGWRCKAGTLPWSLSPVVFPVFSYMKTTDDNDAAERFVWRLDCRLKYICYLLVIKFMIFDYFWGKICLFLMSLWRALHWNATTPR